MEKRNGEQEREGGREKGEDVGTQAENHPPTHTPVHGSREQRGQPGRGGDNEMKRNVARLLEAWGRGRSGGPAGSRSG